MTINLSTSYYIARLHTFIILDGGLMGTTNSKSDVESINFLIFIFVEPCCFSLTLCSNNDFGIDTTRTLGNRLWDK